MFGAFWNSFVWKESEELLGISLLGSFYKCYYIYPHKMKPYYIQLFPPKKIGFPTGLGFSRCTTGLCLGSALFICILKSQLGLSRFISRWFEIGKLLFSLPKTHVGSLRSVQSFSKSVQPILKMSVGVNSSWKILSGS